MHEIRPRDERSEEPVPTVDINACKPTSIRKTADGIIHRLKEGPTMARVVNAPEGFWTTLDKWGGEWMWEGIEKEQPTYKDLGWLVEGMRANSLLWVTDGSYDRK